MPHLPVQIRNLSLDLNHKTRFTNFSTIIYNGQKIALIGKNGSGKTSLLNIIAGNIKPTHGEIISNDNILYIPQIIPENEHLSGSEKFNQAFSQAISKKPSILFLDEPTNHLDINNRNSLTKMLKNCHQTILMATHDIELIRNVADIIWHIHEGKITIFTGNYDDYCQEIQNKRALLEKKLTILGKQKQELHLKLMKEQKRAKNSKIRGEKNIKQRKWPTIVSCTKAGRSEKTSGQKRSQLNLKKQQLGEQLTNLQIAPVLKPKFYFTSIDSPKNISVNISDGSFGYQKMILQGINLQILGQDRVAIIGKNGCGKSTFLKAILNETDINKEGIWQLPDKKYIGYLDQHYNILNNSLNAFELIKNAKINWSDEEVRSHLNDFLFRKNEEVFTQIKELSGGEKCRLSLALIAASTPRILILDEITNNLDITTKEHVKQVLNEYNGSLIIVSHEQEFLNSLDINKSLIITNQQLIYR